MSHQARISPSLYRRLKKEHSERLWNFQKDTIIVDAAKPGKSQGKAVFSPCSNSRARAGRREECLGPKGPWVATARLGGHHTWKESMWDSYKGISLRRGVCSTQTCFTGGSKPGKAMADPALLEAESPQGGGATGWGWAQLKSWNRILIDRAVHCKQVFLSAQGGWERERCRCKKEAVDFSVI